MISSREADEGAAKHGCGARGGCGAGVRLTPASIERGAVQYEFQPAAGFVGGGGLYRGVAAALVGGGWLCGGGADRGGGLHGGGAEDVYGDGGGVCEDDRR